MAEPLLISSTEQFNSLLSSSKIVVTDFYAEWCGPCHQIAPLYKELSSRLSRPNVITFTKVDVDKQKAIARTYEITAMPTFVIFKNAQVVSKVVGADRNMLSSAIKKLAAEADSNGDGGFSGASGDAGRNMWLGVELPKGYSDVTTEVDIKGLDLLNVDSELGSARVLFNESKPSGKSRKAAAAAASSSSSAKGKEKASSSSSSDTNDNNKDDQNQVDWIESDTDEQMMLFMPFQSSLKIHSLQITSLPSREDDGDEEMPMRPKTLNVYSNRAHVLGFEEAEDIPATQTITLTSRDWDQKTGTAKVELRFVKFQSVTSLVLFVVDGEGDGERVRLDRIRIVGEVGRKREMGKLEKIGDEPGE
ncbi:MAG: hypothetical protein M1816_002997 [Peltula sp. TS41687]|nr:MAG: hypothetical protein M1816_002997 [Peltula sp. TS41687]